MADRKSFLLRIDPGLRADLEAWAQEELRSVNGQIEYLLKQAVNRRKGGARLGPQAGAAGGLDQNSTPGGEIRNASQEPVPKLPPQQ